ncbi:MAG: phosphomethylpyrimidine synthase ThiC, partial [Candidatus Thermoplasmatota archaeon]
MTQISVAKQRKITAQMKQVARSEKIAAEVVRKEVAAGHIVIPYNPIHSPSSLGIGKGLRVKVNANIGTSREYCNAREEVEKAKAAVAAGAHAVMD